MFAYGFSRPMIRQSPCTSGTISRASDSSFVEVPHRRSMQSRRTVAPRSSAREISVEDTTGPAAPRSRLRVGRKGIAGSTRDSVIDSHESVTEWRRASGP